MIKLTAFQIGLIHHILDEYRLFIRVFKLSVSYQFIIAVSQAFDAGCLQRIHGTGCFGSRIIMGVCPRDVVSGAGLAEVGFMDGVNFTFPIYGESGQRSHITIIRIYHRLVLHVLENGLEIVH